MSCIVKAGEGDVLKVLGMPLRFLCDAKDTDGAWSLMEEDIPLGLGPPAHRHDWDEACYVIEGALPRVSQLVGVRSQTNPPDRRRWRFPTAEPIE